MDLQVLALPDATVDTSGVQQVAVNVGESNFGEISLRIMSNSSVDSTVLLGTVTASVMATVVLKKLRRKSCT